MLPEYLAMYVEIYSFLSAQRGHSMDGVEPIPMSEILIMASEYEIDDRDTFIRHMCVMDRAHRRSISKKS